MDLHFGPMKMILTSNFIFGKTVVVCRLISHNVCVITHGWFQLSTIARTN